MIWFLLWCCHVDIVSHCIHYGGSESIGACSHTHVERYHGLMSLFYIFSLFPDCLGRRLGPKLLGRIDDSGVYLSCSSNSVIYHHLFIVVYSIFSTLFILHGNSLKLQ